MNRETEAKVRVAGFWRRIVAGLIDLSLVGPVAAIVLWVTARLLSFHWPSNALWPESLLELILEADIAFLTLVSLGIALVLLYGFVFVSITGSTPGLKLLKIGVINIYGGKPEWWRVLLRCTGMIVSVFCLGLGIVWIGIDREKRGFHDWIAGTYVVYQ